MSRARYLIEAALGGGKDYKTRHNLATRKLKVHQTRMEELVKAGYSKEEASKIAYDEIRKGKLKF